VYWGGAEYFSELETVQTEQPGLFEVLEEAVDEQTV